MLIDPAQEVVASCLPEEMEGIGDQDAIVAAGNGVAQDIGGQICESVCSSLLGKQLASFSGARQLLTGPRCLLLPAAAPWCYTLQNFIGCPKKGKKTFFCLSLVLALLGSKESRTTEREDHGDLYHSADESGDEELELSGDGGPVLPTRQLRADLDEE